MTSRAEELATKSKWAEEAVTLSSRGQESLTMSSWSEESVALSQEETVSSQAEI